jgi:hypothetical protein
LTEGGGRQHGRSGGGGERGEGAAGEDYRHLEVLFRHCEERSDEAIHATPAFDWVASSLRFSQ